MTRHGDVEIERLLVLTFVKDRLQGGGSVLHVPGIDGTGWWFAFPRESPGDASTLSVAPTEGEVRAFVSEQDGVQAFSEGTGWLGSRRRPSSRLHLGAGTWVVCFGTDAPPEWVRKLAAASEPELAARMLAAASLSLGWRELASTGKEPARRWRRVAAPRPPIVVTGPETGRRLAGAGWLERTWLEPRRSRWMAVWTASAVLVVAVLLLLVTPRLPRWPFGPDAREEPRNPTDRARGAAAGTGKSARPAPKVVAQPPDPCAVLKATRPATGRFCAAVAAHDGVDDPGFEEHLRRLQTRACGGQSTCHAPVWDAEMIAALQDLYSRLLLSRFAGDIARHLDPTDPYRGAIKSIAPTEDRARRAVAQAMANDPDWQELWRGARAPEPHELVRETIASLPVAPRRPLTHQK